MKAYVLAAGYGKRLEPLTKAVPKPMCPVANKPIMQYNIELLKKYGVRDLVTNIHYFPEQIENYFQDGSALGVNLRYSYEEELLGTAGGVKRMAAASKPGGTFIVIASDILTDINISKLVAFHKSKKSLATIALVPVDDVAQFGVVVTDKDGRITAFQEKPAPHEALSDHINTGVYVFEPEILDMIPANRPYDFGKEVFPELVIKGRPFFGCKVVEYWNDVGGLDKLRTANADILQGRVRAEVPAKRTGSSSWIGKNTSIDKSAKFEGTILLGDRAVVGKNVQIYGNVSIGDKCVIEDGTVISDSVIWSDTRVGKNSRLDKCIVGSWCGIGDNVKIEEACVISNRCSIKNGQRIEKGTKIEPDGIL